MSRVVTFLTLLILLAAPGLVRAQAERVALPVATGSGHFTLQADLYRPAVDRPGPAVVLMHGCGGISSNQARWGAELAGAGFAVLAVDSFTGRGVKEVCTGKQTVAARDRVFDVQAATAWLAAQSFVLPNRIGLIGYSHGAATTLFATLKVSGDRGAPLPAPGFAAAVAFYPDCSLRGSNPTSATAERPLLILVGEKDDWTPAARCQELMKVMQGEPVVLQTYPDAVHGFDSVTSKLRYRDDVRNRNKPGGCCGAWIGYDEGSARDARQRVHDFFERYLVKGQ